MSDSPSHGIGAWLWRGKPWLVSTTVAGTPFGVGGALVASVFFRSAIGEGYERMPFNAGVAAFLAGAGLFRAFVVGRESLLRGGVAGALVGIVAHPLAWYLLLLQTYVSGARSSLGEPTVGPVYGVYGAFAFSIWSWLLAGWLTVPVAGLIGIFTSAVLQALRHRREDLGRTSGERGEKGTGR